MNERSLIQKLSILKYYLKNKQISKETIQSHIYRSAIILGNKRRWSLNEAKLFVLNRAEERDYKASTINKWIQTFNHLNKSLGWRWKTNLTKIKENNNPPEMMSLEESLKFYRLNTTPKWNLIIKLQMTTGARPSEILRLKRKDVDTERRIITITKTKINTSRILVIQDFLIGEIKAFIKSKKLKRDDLMFSYLNYRQPLSEQALIKEYKKRLRILGIDKNVRPYSLRHAYLTRMAGEINMALLMELAGHKNAKTTLRYVHNNEFALKKASEKDFLFHCFRDNSNRVNNIIEQIQDLINQSSDCNEIALSEAIVCLRKAVC